MTVTSRSTGETADPTPTDAAVPLAVSGLTVSYPTYGRGRVRVLEDVTFDLRPGETLGLVGESGSGKSMTALSILKLHEMSGGRVDAGSIRYFGRDITDLTNRQMADIRGAEIAMIFQDAAASLDPAHTVGHQLCNVLMRHTDVSRKQAKARAVELLGDVGIPAPDRRVNQFPYEFSGGMCQRVMIAIALSCEPKVLLADEPTTALDVTTQAQIVQLIQRLSAERGMSTIFTTHDLSLVSEMCDRVAVMYAGEIVEIGRAEDMFSAPTHPYTQALLDCVTVPAARGQFAPIAGQAPSLFERPDGCRFHPRCSFAVDACRSGDVLMRDVGRGQSTRCLRAEEVSLPGVVE